jgi:hypothetical protein
MSPSSSDKKGASCALAARLPPAPPRPAPSCWVLACCWFGGEAAGKAAAVLAA